MVDDDIARVLEALRSDSSRCAVPPASMVRRRGDRRRVAVRAAATGGTIVFVGATAGTAFAVAHQPAPRPGVGHVGIADDPSSTPSPVPSALGGSSASPTPIPSVSPSASPGPSTPPTSTPPSPSPGTAQPTATPTPSSS